MTTVGAVFLPQLPPERLRSVATAAQDAGLAELWVWEDCFAESGIAAAAAALAWTSTLHVGIGVLPVPLRNPALTAMELATLARLFPGRLVAGVGHGVQDWMGQVGGRVSSPLTLLGEHLRVLSALLRGESVTCAGRYTHLSDVALAWPPSVPLPVLAAAEGPRTQELSGRLADGTVLAGGTSPDAVRAARAAIDVGRAVAGRTDPHRVVVYLLAATGRDGPARLRPAVATWGSTGRHDVAVAGDATEVAAAVARFADAGADTVVLQPTPDDPDPEGFVRFVGEEVGPLVG